MSEPTTIELGEESYTLKARPMPRVVRALFGLQGQLGSLDDGADLSDAGAVVAVLGDQAHAFLRIFIPDLMPAWKFEGFASQGAKDAGEVDEQAEEKAPTFPQVLEAVEAIFRVNGGERLKQIVGKLLGETAADLMRRRMVAVVSQRLQSWLSTNGASTPPTSGTNGSDQPVAVL